MKEFIDELISRLEKEKRSLFNTMAGVTNSNINNQICGLDKAIKTVNQLAEEYKHCDFCYLGSPCEYQNPEISCEKCIEYDTEEHCCPKFCKVITDTIQEMKEEHHNNDFCEWTEISVGGIIAVKEPHRMKLLNCDHEQKFCHYCGKKIKIAPYQPKGE